MSKSISEIKIEFEQAGELYISTEDGSVGTKGNVMDAIRENALEAEMIYASPDVPIHKGVEARGKKFYP